jgi:hypothetical protein
MSQLKLDWLGKKSVQHLRLKTVAEGEDDAGICRIERGCSFLVFIH